MKPTRIPQSSLSEVIQPVSSISRGFSPNQETKIKGKVSVEKISRKVSEVCADNDGVALRLKDEFSGEVIASVIKECRDMVSEKSMTSGNWNAIREYLSDELWEFSRLKEELVQVERKCGMVQQKASEISEFGKSGNADEMRNRLMACAMLLAETEMRRDNLSERISMIIDQFTKQILLDLAGSDSHTGLELRLRSVFGSL